MKRILFITAILMSSTAGVSHAADMNYMERPIPSQTNVEYGSGWYLRGDIGYTISTNTDLSYVSDQRYDYDDQSIGESSSWGLGVGYTFSDMLRGDITFETSDGHEWDGTSVGTLCGGGTPGDCFSEDSADFDRNSLMANAYVSLGNYHGFSPYVGAGLGVTHVQWNNYESDAYCTVDVGETCSYGAHSGVGTDAETYYGGRTSYGTESATALTYALAAGFDYRLNQNWLFDMGYKWTTIDGGVVIKKDANGIGSPQGSSKFDSIHMHEVKVGLRYEIW